MTWRPNVTVAAIVQREGKFLLVEERAQGAIVYNQPAGHLEQGESLIQAVVRETLEETAWHFAPQALIGIYRWQHPKRDLTYLRFAFSGELLRHETQRELDSAIIRTVWLSPEEIRHLAAQHRSPQVQLCINDYLAGRRVSLDLLNDLDDQANTRTD